MAINSNMRPAEMFQLRLYEKLGGRRQRPAVTGFSAIADALRYAGTAYASGQITQGAQDRREAANADVLKMIMPRAQETLPMFSPGQVQGTGMAAAGDDFAAPIGPRQGAAPIPGTGYQPGMAELVKAMGNEDASSEMRQIASTLMAQQYASGERVAKQEWQDDQRIAGQEFRSGERVAGAIFTREQNRKTLENRNTIAKLQIESRDANAKTRSENSQKIQQLKQYESDLKTPVKTETMTGRRLSEIQMELHGETDISLANMNSDFVVKRNKFDRITSITPVGADISPTGIVRSEVAQALQNVGGKPQGPVSDNAQRESTTTVDATGATGLADTPFRYLGQLNEMLTGSISEKSRAAQVVKRLVNKTTRTMVQNDNGKPSVWASKAIKDILPKVGAFITDRDYIDATNSVITELNRTIDRKLALSNNFSLRADVRSNASSDIVRLKELREDWRRTLPRGSEPNAAVNLEAVERARKKLEAD